MQSTDPETPATSSAERQIKTKKTENGPKPKFVIEAYKGRHILYILDACAPAVDNDFLFQTEHYQKQRNTRELFKRFGDGYEIKDVSFKKRSQPQAVLDYFQQEVDDWTKDDQIVVYFHGLGANNGEDYTWQFVHGFPRKPIDAYDLLKMIVRADVDCMLLVDAWIPDRFHDLRGLVVDSDLENDDEEGGSFEDEDCDSNVEVIAKGETMQIGNGLADRSGKGDFSHQLVGTMQNLIEKDIGWYCESCSERSFTPSRCGRCRNRMKKGVFASRVAPLTLLELIIQNDTRGRKKKEINSRIRRVNVHRDKRQSRFMLVPDTIRETGKFKFFARRKIFEIEADEKATESESVAAQEDMESVGGAGNGEMDVDDEGYGEDDTSPNANELTKEHLFN